MKKLWIIGLLVIFVLMSGCNGNETEVQPPAQTITPGATQTMTATPGVTQTMTVTPAGTITLTAAP